MSGQLKQSPLLSRREKVGSGFDHLERFWLRENIMYILYGISVNMLVSIEL